MEAIVGVVVVRTDRGRQHSNDEISGGVVTRTRLGTKVDCVSTTA